MNIKFYKKLSSFFSSTALLRACARFFLSFVHIRNTCIFNAAKWMVFCVGTLLLTLFFLVYHEIAFSASLTSEPVQACVVARDVDLTDAIRAKFAECLGWQSDQSSPICQGSYQPVTVIPLANPEEVRILADSASFYRNKRSTLSGHVEVQQNQKVVNAQTAYVYRDSKTNKVTKVEFLGEVRYLEPDKLMIARKAEFNPEDKSGETVDVLYRFNSEKSGAILPAWGRAGLIRRFSNKNYFLSLATYTTCAPQDKAWDIQAESITLDDAKATGVARNAKIRVHDHTVFYTPYLSFPTNKERKSGFLMPIVGSSETGGFDLGLPYYWNIAPNHDLTLIPHVYSKRGLLMGGEFRYLTSNSIGTINGSFMPNDKAYSQFIQNNETEFPQLRGNSTNRWAFGFLETTNFTPNLKFNLNVQEISDDYYLQDFNTNLALVTQRQLLRQADLTYTTENWLFRAMGQSYQTLHPVNEIPISPVYERLPQLMAHGFYYDLPFNANLSLLGQYDQFHWPNGEWDNLLFARPQGPRFHLNPILSLPQIKPWGYVTPSVQFVENYYEVQYNNNIGNIDFNRTIPRASIDGGLFFERDFHFFGSAITQTLEPRLFYLNVPYQDQTTIPVYDSANMIFNVDQLFRTNRFSGFDRIGDANQLSYAITTRFLSDTTGGERAYFSIGQIKYFENRKVQLCYNINGFCVDSPYAFGALSPTSDTSPIASRAGYHFNPVLGLVGNYAWDPATNATNNGDLILHYQPEINKIISFGYSYLVNGDVTQVSQSGTEDNALHQAIAAFSWPLTEKWSTVGAYSHNISKNYSMMSLLGVQYDSCCWAMRVLGGRTFKNLNAGFEPQYNDNVYFQVLLKGLGSVANNDPYNILTTYIPGYSDPFRR